VTHVTGEIENNINTTNEVICNVIGSDISANYLNPISNPVQVKWVTSLRRQECINDYHLDAQLHEAAGKIAADKTHATRNQDGATIILRMKFIHFHTQPYLVCAPQKHGS
jgi:hypothetical protein